MFNSDPAFREFRGNLDNGPKANESSGGFFSLVESTKRSLGLASEEERGICDLSWRMRMAGAGTFFFLGALFILLASFSILSPRSFGKYYSVGSLCVIGSSLFLMGPKQQIARLADPSRLYAALFYFGSLFATMYTALGMQSTVLTLLLVIVQVIASVWYLASYIPFAQSCLHGAASSILPL